MSGIGGRRSRAVHGIKEQFQLPGPDMVLEQSPVFIRCDRSRPPADVTLDPSAQPVIAPAWKKPPPDCSEIFVLLVSKGGKRVEVYLNNDRLGTLATADSADSLPAIASANDGQPVVGEASRVL